MIFSFEIWNPPPPVLKDIQIRSRFLEQLVEGRANKIYQQVDDIVPFISFIGEPWSKISNNVHGWRIRLEIFIAFLALLIPY